MAKECVFCRENHWEKYPGYIFCPECGINRPKPPTHLDDNLKQLDEIISNLRELRERLG